MSAHGHGSEWLVLEVNVDFLFRIKICARAQESILVPRLPQPGQDLTNTALAF